MRCVIFGAGKIARGFIGHLLYLSGIPFTFVEKADALADLINERGEYTVNILGAPEKNCVVKGAKALKFDQAEEIAEAIAEADAVFNAVGGKNLGDIVPFLTAGIEKKARRGGKINFVTCENWKKPADILRDGIAARISEEARPYFEENVGITEAVIMRSAIESDAELLKKDPLIVNVQNFWELPVDASRLKGELPPIQGLKLIAEFTGFLERKFYTYNAANGTVSYLGGLLGYEKIADAAHDEWILKILDGVYGETARALSAKVSTPEFKAMIEDLWKINELNEEYQKNSAKLNEIVYEMGYPIFKGGQAAVPFDSYSDGYRGTLLSLQDLYANPDEIERYIEAAIGPMLENIHMMAKRPNAKGKHVFMALHKGMDGFMNDEHYRKYYWRHLQMIIEEIIKVDMVPYIFCGIYVFSILLVTTG